MNIKMTTNSQLSTTEPKQKQTRTRTDSQKGRSHAWRIISREWRVKNGGKVQGIRNIIGR